MGTVVGRGISLWFVSLYSYLCVSIEHLICIQQQEGKKSSTYRITKVTTWNYIALKITGIPLQIPLDRLLVQYWKQPLSPKPMNGVCRSKSNIVWCMPVYCNTPHRLGNTDSQQTDVNTTLTDPHHPLFVHLYRGVK